MADAAYASFFVAVLLGSASLLHLTLQHEWRRISAALRREPLDEPMIVTLAADDVSVREKLHPALEPVTISICRI